MSADRIREIEERAQMASTTGLFDEDLEIVDKDIPYLLSLARSAQKLAKVVEKVEWNDWRYCLWCGGEGKHSDDCIRQEALAEFRKLEGK